MELEISAEQFSLQNNQFICTQLDYSAIVSHLIQAKVLNEQLDSQIQLETQVNAERIQKLMSKLHEMNSKASFAAFIEGVNQVGETVLAQKLLWDQNQSSFGAGDAHLCLSTIDVMSKIFCYLNQPELRKARLVCRAWNAIISEHYSHQFTVKFLPHSGDKQMIEFVSTAPGSVFCKKLSRFSIGIETMMPGAWVFYRTFFVNYGSQIQKLVLNDVNKDLLGFIFSLEIQARLCNLKHLELILLTVNLVLFDSLNFLSGLETLNLTVWAAREPRDCINFLEKVLENDHKLKVLRVDLNSTQISMEEFLNLNDLLPKLFKSPYLENLTIDGMCPLDDVALGLMTFPNAGGLLKTIDLMLKSVSPKIYRDFLGSYSQTLQQLHIVIESYANDNVFGLWQALPSLIALQHLSIEDSYGVSSSWDSIYGLGFCTQAPSLKSLKISNMMLQLPVGLQPPFVHEGLQKLSLLFNDLSQVELIFDFLSRVPHCFPKLMQLRVGVVDLHIDWPMQVGELRRRLCSPDTTTGSMERREEFGTTKNKADYHK